MNTLAEQQGLIRVLFPWKGGQTGQVVLEWSPSMTVKHYFNHESLRPFHLLAMRNRCTLTDQNGRRLRLRSLIKAGDTIILTRVARSMS